MLNSNLKVLEADSFKKQETGVGKRYLLIYLFIYLFSYSLLLIYFSFVEKVQNPKIVISAEFLLNLAPVRRRCNEIGYPRGF